MKSHTISKILMVILSLLIVANIYVTLKERGLLEVKVYNSLARVTEVMDSITQPEDGEDGYTPVKGVDYFDGERGPRGFKGEKGDDGEDSTSKYVTETIIKEVPVKGEDGKDGYTPVKGVDYFDGKTPVLRCNESKNRWESKYSGSDNWTIVRNENDQPAECRYLL